MRNEICVLFLSILLTATLQVYSSYAEELKGIVIMVKGDDVTIQLDDQGFVNKGDKVEIYSEAGGLRASYGTWRVSAVNDDGTIEAEPDDMEGPPPTPRLKATIHATGTAAVMRRPSVVAKPRVADEPLVFRDRLQDNSQGPEMVLIRGGCFQMGSPTTEKGREDDERQHRVCVNDFAMGKYEITYDEYDHFSEVTGRRKPDREGSGRGDTPLVWVSWTDATAFTQWLSSQTGKNYRLPTEAEWEYAARGGTTTAYWWGENIGRDNAHCDGCSSSKENDTVPVGTFKSNPFGLYDMLGNVEEWTCSSYDEDYNGGEQLCESYPGEMAVRGGSFVDGPRFARSASRSSRYNESFFHTSYGSGYYWIGFRLARDLEQ